MKDLVIAIDGYSSCGKSTVARSLAERLGIRYVDTGAMYRAVTLKFLTEHVAVPGPEDRKSIDSINKVLDNADITFSINAESGATDILLNGEVVSELIRSMEVSDKVSDVSAIPEVRQRMVRLQQGLDRSGGIVMDGRDIGTTVLPDADLKVFMTASPSVRAKRRYDELKAKGLDVSLDQVTANIAKRDEEDVNRKISPLVKAQDAVLLDNSEMDRNQQLEFIIRELETRGLLENRD